MLQHAIVTAGGSIMSSGDWKVNSYSFAGAGTECGERASVGVPCEAGFRSRIKLSCMALAKASLLAS